MTVPRTRSQPRAFRQGGSRFVALAAVLLALIAALACDGERPAERVAVHVGAATFDAELALSSKEHVNGLSGRHVLAPNAGMLFVFPEDGDEPFVMRGMRFPLDFIWIGPRKRVVVVTQNVPPPAEGAGETASAVLRACQPISYVLEVNAGVVAELGISVGDEVTFEPEVDRTRAQ